MKLNFEAFVVLGLVSTVLARPPQLPPGPLAASMRDGLPVQRGAGSAADTEWIDLLTAVELAQTLPMLSELRKIYDKTEMGFKLEQSRHITIFMPSNDALKASNLNLLNMNYADSIRVLQLHIVPELIKTSELPDGVYEYESMAGVNLTVSISRAAVKGRSRGNGNGATATNNNNINNNNNNNNMMRRASPLHVNVGPVDSSLKATVIDPYGVDNANGVSYITNTLLVPADVAEKYASSPSGMAEDGSYDDGEFAVPDYIETTNQFHWQYGRVGGIPDLQAPPQIKEPQTETLRGSRGGGGDTTAPDDTDETVGVLGAATPSLRTRGTRPVREVHSAEDYSGEDREERSVRRARRRTRGDEGAAERI